MTDQWKFLGNMAGLGSWTDASAPRVSPLHMRPFSIPPHSKRRRVTGIVTRHPLPILQHTPATPPGHAAVGPTDTAFCCGSATARRRRRLVPSPDAMVAVLTGGLLASCTACLERAAAGLDCTEHCPCRNPALPATAQTHRLNASCPGSDPPPCLLVFLFRHGWAVTVEAVTLPRELLPYTQDALAFLHDIDMQVSLLMCLIGRTVTLMNCLSASRASLGICFWS